LPGSVARHLYCNPNWVRPVVGYLAVRFLLRFLASHTLRVFPYYSFALAAVVAVVLLSSGT
jgi:undecaprenyl pyrophosphate phosphatase UppP